MNSLLSNLGPRYSRRNSTTPIVLGFLLLIIAIAVVTYFIKRDDEDDDDGKDKKDENEGETVPSIDDITVKSTFNPDSSESGTTETYEIGGGKTETYQIEYNNGISDLQLSQNVMIDITWSNKSGFENVYKIEVEHYVTATSATVTSSVPNATKPINRYDSTGNEIDNTKEFFKNFKTGLVQKFLGLEPANQKAYSFVGNNTIAIKAWYGDSTKPDAENAVVDLYRGDPTVDTDIVPVSSGDLAATLTLTSPIERVYKPIQGSFTLGEAVIANKSYYAATILTSPSADIYQSISGKSTNTAKPFTLIRTSDNSNNQFYFKFSNTEYLGYDTNNNLSVNSTANQIITLVSSPEEGGDIFRLSFDLTIDSVTVPHYIVIDNNIGVVKPMSEIESQDVYNTLDWKLTEEVSDVWGAFPDEIELTGGVKRTATSGTLTLTRYFKKLNKEPDDDGYIGYGWYEKGWDNEPHKRPVTHVNSNDCYGIKVKVADNTWERLKQCGNMYALKTSVNGTVLSAQHSDNSSDAWVLTIPEISYSQALTCDQPAARQCITDLMEAEATGSEYFLATVDTVEGVACSTKFNCAPDIWFSSG